jgi:hypothetical protein
VLEFGGQPCPTACAYNLWGSEFAGAEVKGFTGTVNMATDGSTFKDCNSTAAVVYLDDDFVQAKGRPAVSQYEHWKLGVRNNRHAECSALLMAVCSVPATVHCRVITDSKAGKSMHDNMLANPPTTNMLLRMAARPYMVMLHGVVNARQMNHGATTTIDWTPAHTEAEDLDSLGNHAADRHAKEANKEEAGVAEPDEEWRRYLMRGELEYFLRCGGEPVHDDTRKTIRECARREAEDRWIEEGRSTSRLFAENREALAEVRRQVAAGPSGPTEAFILLATGSINCRDTKYSNTQRPKEKACLECGFYKVDTAEHYASCPELEKGGASILNAIHKVVLEAKEKGGSEGQPLAYEPEYLADMLGAEYEILGCRDQGADAVCCTVTQKVARGLARKLVGRTRSVDRELSKVQIQMVDRAGMWKGLWSRPFTKENLSYAAWQAIGVEVKSRTSGKTGGRDWGSKAVRDLLNLVTDCLGEHRDEQELPLGLVRMVAALCATTAVVAMDPLNGTLPHLPWHRPGRRAGQRAHIGFGELSGENSLSMTSNWAGKSILVGGLVQGRRAREASDPLRCGVAKLIKIVGGLAEPTRIVKIQPEGSYPNPLCLVTAKKDGLTLEVILIENEAARITRPISAATVARLCSEHNEEPVDADAKQWVMYPPRITSWSQRSGKDRPTPRNRPRLPGARSFSVAAMVYESMDPTTLREGGLENDGKVRDYSSEPIGAARVGIVPRGVMYMLKQIGFKEIGLLTTRIREAVLWTQYRRIQRKRCKRAYHVFDDMG